MSALYDPSTLGTSSNKITFNDFSASPVYRVRETRPQRRQVREQDAPIPNESGVADFDTLIGQMDFIIEGQMYPYGEAEFYDGRRALRSVSSLDIAQNDPLSDGGYVPYIWQEAGVYKVAYVKVKYVDGLNESTRTGLIQPFRFVCKMKQPFIYDLEAVTTTIGINTTGTPVGVTGFPLSLPALIGKVTYQGAGGTVINKGDQEAYPAFNIIGPINKPRLTNTTTGEYLEIDVNLATVNDVLSISYDADTAPRVTVAGNSVYNKKSAGSTFFKVKPGANELTLTGNTIGNGAQATVSFYSTYSMS